MHFVVLDHFGNGLFAIPLVAGIIGPGNRRRIYRDASVIQA